MKIAPALLVAAFLCTAAAFARQPQATFRVHTEANPNDTSTFSIPVQLQFSGKRTFLEKSPTIFEADVAGFYPYRAADGTYGALIQLNPHGTLALDTMSIDRRGSYVVIFVNGRQTTEMQVDRRVSDGKIYIPAGLNEEDIKLMNKGWHLIGKKK